MYSLYTGKKQLIKILLKKAQMMNIVDKHFKSASSDVVKEVKENIRIMYCQRENINIETESIQKDQMEILI